MQGTFRESKSKKKKKKENEDFFVLYIENNVFFESELLGFEVYHNKLLTPCTLQNSNTYGELNDLRSNERLCLALFCRFKSILNFYLGKSWPQHTYFVRLLYISVKHFKKIVQVLKLL